MYEKFTCLFWNSNYTTDIEVVLHYYYYTNTARVLFLYKSYKEFFWQNDPWQTTCRIVLFFEEYIEVDKKRLLFIRTAGD